MVCIINAGVFHDLCSSLIFVITVILDPHHVVLMVFYSCILYITAEVRTFQRCTVHQPHMRVISIIIMQGYLASLSDLTGCFFFAFARQQPA